MEKYEKPIIEKEESVKDSFEIKNTSEQIRQLLEVEKQGNPEYRECLEQLQQEYDYRIAKANLFVERLSSDMRGFDWFIVPPVMTRTDYGYSNDIDLVVVHDSSVKPPKYDKYIEDVFMMPIFITREEIAEMGSKYPEVTEYYQTKLTEEKPEGNPSNEKIETSLLEDKLRYSIEPEKREKLRNYRIVLANHFIKEAKKRIDILSWDISGSTVADIERFSVCSDLDLEILVDPKTSEQEQEIFFYLHKYLKYKFAEDFETKICFTETSLEFIKGMVEFEPKMKDFFERQFRIKLD